jgi:flagellar biosynthetic protein FliP
LSVEVGRTLADHSGMTTRALASLARIDFGTLRAHRPHRAGGRSWPRFIGHFMEMVVAMFLGMGIVTAIFGMAHDSPIEIQALYMAVSMIVPMVGWMLVRGHTMRASTEMGAAMFVPLAVLFPMLWAGVIGDGLVLDLSHLLMVPAMLGAMLYRRSAYGL